ncbi:MAG: hypothetical protein NT007_14285 [Candidatus Kapabacteria bacterium]|nr:hypothetical protein [Candidatus Kapabacteria bacterium]
MQNAECRMGNGRNGNTLDKISDGRKIAVICAHEAVSKASFLSFQRMQESPKVALEGDSCIRRNDILLEFSSFHTVSFAGMSIH